MLHHMRCFNHGLHRRLLFSLLIISATAAAEPAKLRIGFICAAGPDHPFWGQVAQVMQAAANDLDIDLIVKYDLSRSSYASKKAGIQLLGSDPKLDYMLTPYWGSVTPAHLEYAQQHGIKVFAFNSDVPEAEYEEVGQFPRQKYANWIGHMVPDDKVAGYDLAAALFERARKTNGATRISVLALNGPFESTVGTSRLAGLKSKVEEESGAVLEDVVLTNWEAGAASKTAADLLTKYPGVDVLWAPNESITWGALLAVEKSGKTPGKDIYIGGFDWNPESAKAIADGRITASMFGHFLEGAWALILAHDYHHGFDFADDKGVRITTPLNIINAGNYKQYTNLLQEGNWEQVDFRKFSKKYNPQLKSYNFNISQFLE
ncbi:MAG TPA: ABC transporter substrate-binding protein [Gammaproteobacteria bacterium]